MRTALALILPFLLAAQSALLQIRIEGDGSVFAPGSRTPGVTVEITDELGKPVAGAVISLRLPDDGPGGTFANGLSSEIILTGTNGRATTSPVRWNRVPGPLEIRVTAVKGQLRAGTVATCELSEAAVAAKSAPAPPIPERSKSRLRVKWIVVAAVAAAAAGVGFASRRATIGSSGSGGSGGGAAGSVEIGTPTITIGNP